MPTVFRRYNDNNHDVDDYNDFPASAFAVTSLPFILFSPARPSPTRGPNGEVFGRDKSPAGRGFKSNGTRSTGETSDANGDGGNVAVATTPGGSGAKGATDIMRPIPPATGAGEDGVSGGDGSGDDVWADGDDGAVEEKDYESR